VTTARWDLVLSTDTGVGAPFDGVDAQASKGSGSTGSRSSSSRIR
jgi:hypothetical protein